ncbi:hypothetical protein BKN38_08690 [Helicobacter sp. CLO-3]|nr:hypothetical protein BA723_07435 [Helicobacter sp. CLO-3]OHU81585.1 hypothetical protein BKN38_08690 [Helicobacter sp. CLO-3]
MLSQASQSASFFSNDKKRKRQQIVIARSKATKQSILKKKYGFSILWQNLNLCGFNGLLRLASASLAMTAHRCQIICKIQNLDSAIWRCALEICAWLVDVAWRVVCDLVRCPVIHSSCHFAAPMSAIWRAPPCRPVVQRFCALACVLYFPFMQLD